MRGARKDIVIRQGATFWLVFRVLDSLSTTEIVNGEITTIPAVDSDLTGLEFRCEMRATNTAGVVEASLVPAKFTVEEKDGVRWVVMEIPWRMTETMTALKGVYDIELYDPVADEVIEVLYGNYTLELQATKMAVA